MKKVGLIVGSLRKDSWNRKVAEVVKELLPETVEAEFIDISKVPLYNTDLDGTEPAYTEVRKEIAKYDGYMFFVPEYNRSYAPAAKNVIDVGSTNPEGNLWAGKPAAVFSASMGGFGGMAANHALRQVFTFVDLIPMQQPEVYLSKIQEFFDEEGNMVEGTKSFLKGAAEAFVAHMDRLDK
ncbi:MAG: NAD(P)H-dependent oxidoreductase [Tissierellia bacterium]|nr:NAD(P)H-dependent oxidoreductase [Tissierellia bacterium]